MASLLVLDNVHDPTLLCAPVTPDLTPVHLPCRVIFTTRRRDLGDAFTPVELSVLPEAPGLRLLLRHPTRQPALDPAHPDHAAAVEIYNMLGGLPLALEIAGAHLGRLADRPIPAYRDELLARGALAVVDDPHGKVRETDLGTRHAAAVAATLAEQWAILQSDDARQPCAGGRRDVRGRSPGRRDHRHRRRGRECLLSSRVRCSAVGGMLTMSRAPVQHREMYSVSIDFDTEKVDPGNDQDTNCGSCPNNQHITHWFLLVWN